MLCILYMMPHILNIIVLDGHGHIIIQLVDTSAESKYLPTKSFAHPNFID